MKTVRVEPFKVAGYEARTSNPHERAGEGVIPRLWGRKDKPAGAPVVVYSEYASDKDGEYNYLLGTKSGENDTLTEGMVWRTVAAGNYSVFEANGSTPDVIVGLWQQIWVLEDEKNLRRIYQTDFELYSGSGVEVYIGVAG